MLSTPSVNFDALSSATLIAGPAFGIAFIKLLAVEFLAKKSIPF